MKSIVLSLCLIFSSGIYANEVLKLSEEFAKLITSEAGQGQSDDEVSILLYTMYLDADGQASAAIEQKRKELEQLGGSLEEELLKEELLNFIDGQFIQIKTCKASDWTFTENYPFLYYLSNILSPWNSVEVSSFNFLSKAFKNYLLGLEKIEAQLDQSLADNVLPSHGAMSNLVAQLEFNLDIKDRLEQVPYSYTCKGCQDDFNAEITNKLYRDIVLVKLQEVIAKLKQAMAQAPTTVYAIPESLKDECMTQIMGHVAGLNLTPEELLQVGQRELARAEAKMLSILRKELGDSQLNLEGMNEYLRDIQKEQLEYESAEEYLAIIDRIVVRTQKFLPQVTSKTTSKPKVNDYSYETQAFSPTYSNCTMNVNSLAPDLRYTIANTIVHEGLPGHHLDLCKDGESEIFVAKKDPMKEFIHNTDRIEGWAFYIEEFMGNIGFYETPLEEVGGLEWIRARALRLILSYRYFFSNWTMDQAREFHKKHSVVPEYTVNSEVNRAAGWNGQVLNYMIGKEAIIRMRDRAKAELGAHFSIIAFHDFILKHQSYSLKAISTMLPYWIAEQSEASYGNGQKEYKAN